MFSFLQNHIYLLEQKNFQNPERELKVLLNKTSINKKEIIFSNFDLKQINIKSFKKAFNRRIKNEPISKIFNEKSFWKFDFYVNKYVLDPRPETELIIEEILKVYNNRKKELTILDIGTGSGCLAVSLAKEYLKSKVIATDISNKAIEVAKINAKKMNCEKSINFINCNLINLNKKFDIIVSNPPYLSDSEYANCIEQIKYEPKIAFLGGKDGMKFYRKICQILPKIMHNQSMCLLEIGYNQATDIIKIFNKNNIYCYKIIKDLQTNNRVLVLKKK